MHYVLAWAIDNAYNISVGGARTRINYHPGNERARRGQTKIYRYDVAQDQRLVVDLEAIEGDADLYVWSSNPASSAWVSNLSEGNERVVVPASEVYAGVYQIEVYGYTDATYRLQVTVEAETSTTMGLQDVGGIDPAKQQPDEPILPVSSIPEGSLMQVPTPPQPDTPQQEDQSLYLPLVMR
jgi:hypothetical protein